LALVSGALKIDLSDYLRIWENARIGHTVVFKLKHPKGSAEEQVYDQCQNDPEYISFFQNRYGSRKLKMMPVMVDGHS
jgi:hypothetical protein